MVPYINRLDQAVQPFGLRVGGAGYWGESCLKEPRRLLEAKARISGNSPFGLTGLDPDVEKIGADLFKEVAAEHDLPLVLGINALLMNNGPAKAIIERVKKYIKAGAPGGRFAILLNNIPAHTSPKHIHAAIEAVRVFGSYPISGELDSIRVRTPRKDDFQQFLERKLADNAADYSFCWRQLPSAIC